VPFLLIFAFCLQETKESAGEGSILLFTKSQGNQWALI